MLVPTLAFCQVVQPEQPLDKQAHKIQKMLASFPSGSTVFLEIRDQTQYLGALESLSYATFELSQRKGAVLNLAYADVSPVQRAEARTGSVIVAHITMD